MKYCILYHRKFRYMNQIDEIIIKFRDRQVGLIDFLKKKIKPFQRVIITPEPDVYINNNLDIIEVAKSIHKNIAILLPLEQRDVAIDLSQMNVDFFFNDFVDKWDVLMSYINFGVSDVYIVNELGFELKEVAKVCHEKKVQVRVFPNVAQYSNHIKNLNNFTAFFIRPEDLGFYEPYVDVCELFGEPDKYSVIYDIYTKRSWLGDLKDLIIGLEQSILNNTIMPLFGERRLNCEKKCYQGKCIICEKISTVSKQLEEANLTFTKVKKKGDDNENKSKVTEAINDNEAR